MSRSITSWTPVRDGRNEKSVRKLAEKDLKQQVSDLEKQFGKARTSTRLYEALVLDGKYPYEPGYLAVFRIDDKAAQLEVGTFSWHKTDESQGTSSRQIKRISRDWQSRLVTKPQRGLAT